MGGLVVLGCRGCQFAKELAIFGNCGNNFCFLESIIINKIDFHRFHDVSSYGNMKVATIFLDF